MGPVFGYVRGRNGRSSVFSPVIIHLCYTILDSNVAYIVHMRLISLRTLGTLSFTIALALTFATAARAEVFTDCLTGNGIIECSGGAKLCGGSCQASGPAQPGTPTGTAFTCNSCAWNCGNAGKIDCGGTCVTAPAAPSCAPGQTVGGTACAPVCVGSASVILNPTGAQSGNVSITGNAAAGGEIVSAGGRVDQGDLNAGTLSATTSLRFGGSASGEGILSKRTSGGNQWGLDLFAGGQPRLTVTNAGNVGIGKASSSNQLHILKGAGGGAIGAAAQLVLESDTSQ